MRWTDTIQVPRLVVVLGFVVVGVIVVLIVLNRLTTFYDPANEDRFEYSLAPGLTRGFVAQLVHDTSGRSGPGGVASEPGIRAPRDSVSVYITDYRSICIERGKRYVLVFDSLGRLRYWMVEPWSSACA